MKRRLVIIGIMLGILLIVLLIIGFPHSTDNNFFNFDNNPSNLLRVLLLDIILWLVGLLFFDLALLIKKHESSPGVISFSTQAGCFGGIAWFTALAVTIILISITFGC